MTSRTGPIEAMDTAIILHASKLPDYDVADMWINLTMDERRGILCAALRGLAEMEPAEEIRSHIHDVWAKAYMGDSTSEEACMLGCKTYILDAANG